MTTNEYVARQNVALMLSQSLRGAKAAAKVYRDPIAREEAKVLHSLLLTVQATVEQEAAKLR